MPVSPIQKQDLMLVKEAFERKALEKNNVGATWLPMVTTVQQSRRVHETIRDEASRYPAVRANNNRVKNNQSFLKQKQSECIPCLDRILDATDLDMLGDLFANLLAFNDRSIKNMLNLFNSLYLPNDIQRDLCGAYNALRSQCIPDIARLITQLKFLMEDIRKVKLKGLKDSLITLVGTAIVKSLILGSINYDMYVNLITNTTRCIARDINAQLIKLEPILSSEGLEDIADLFSNDQGAGSSNSSKTRRQQQEEVFKRAEDIRDIQRIAAASREGGDEAVAKILDEGALSRSKAESADQKAEEWVPNTDAFNYTKDASKAIAGLQDKIEKKANSFKNSNNKDQVPRNELDIGYLIKDMIEESINVVEDKSDNSKSELLKILKLSDSSLNKQIKAINQIRQVLSVLEILKTIKDTRGDYDPCGRNAGKKFFTKINFPGQDILVDTVNPEDPILTILPPTIKITNPVVEDILNENGIDTGPVKSGRIVNSLPVEINISKCLDGKQQ